MSKVSQKELIAMMMNMGKEDTSLTLLDSLEKSGRQLEDVAKTSVALNDEYGNSLTAIGTDDKVAQFTNYSFSNNTLNYLLWLSLYNDSWVFKRAIDKPSQDEVRCGITLQGTSNKEAAYREFKRYSFDLIQLLQWGALFGGSVAVMMFDNIVDKEYALPMNKEKVKQSKSMRLYVTDRWYGCAPTYDITVTDMNSLDYGKPKYYDITFADGKSMRVHCDYILRYEHRTAPKLVKTGQLQGWGYAEGSHILNELMRDDKLKSSIQSLVDKSLIEVIKMAGMRGVFLGADQENNDQLKQRLEMVNWGRTHNSLTFLDKDDEYQEHGFSGLGGLADLLQQNMWQISSALEMQGVLFGDLKNGFSVDVNALERYAEVINGRCESYVRPVYEKFLRVIYLRTGIDEKVEFEFNDLMQKQQDEKQMDNIQKFVGLCSSLLNDGIISAKQFATALRTYSNKGVIDFDLTDANIDKLDDDINKEDFDLGNETLI